VVSPTTLKARRTAARAAQFRDRRFAAASVYPR
jgi:hypothetical protein